MYVYCIERNVNISITRITRDAFDILLLVMISLYTCQLPGLSFAPSFFSFITLSIRCREGVMLLLLPVHLNLASMIFGTTIHASFNIEYSCFHSFLLYDARAHALHEPYLLSAVRGSHDATVRKWQPILYILPINSTSKGIALKKGKETRLGHRQGMKYVYINIS